MPNNPKTIHVLAFANVQLLDVTGPLQVFASAHPVLGAYEAAVEARSVLGALVARVAVFDRRKHASESTPSAG